MLKPCLLGPCPRWQRALFLLHSEDEKDLTGFNAAISACQKRGEWQLALSLMAEAWDAELQLDEISYNAAMAACGKGQEWQMALELFQARGHLPNSFFFLLSNCSAVQSIVCHPTSLRASKNRPLALGSPMGSPRDCRSSDSFGGFSRSWTPTAGEVSWRRWPGPPSGNRPWCCGRNPRLNGEGMCSEPRRCGLGEFCVWRWGCHISKLQKGRKLVKSYQKSGK